MQISCANVARFEVRLNEFDPPILFISRHFVVFRPACIDRIGGSILDIYIEGIRKDQENEGKVRKVSMKHKLKRA